MRFAKGHGTENDFVILPDPDGQAGLPPGLAARLCDRRAGIGGDGVLRVVRTAAAGCPAGPDQLAGAEWFMDYRNADGSVAEMCGNGIRVFTRYLLDHGLASGPDVAVATRSGVRPVRAEPDGRITVGMGPVSVLGAGRAVIAGQACEGLRISVGNPHLACVAGDVLGSWDLSVPPVLDPVDFPEGGNVELVRLAGPGRITMRVHERGSGETRSCGTGAVAAAVAAAIATGGASPAAGGAFPAAGGASPATGGRPGERQAWQVGVPGGHLTVTLEAGAAWLTGPAVIVAEGDLDPRWLAAC
jgi:diaminopimelate epimerase